MLAVVVAVTGYGCNDDDEDELLELHDFCLCIFFLLIWFLLFREQAFDFAVDGSKRGELVTEIGAVAAFFCSKLRVGKLLHFLSNVWLFLLSEWVMNWRADDEEFKWEMIGFLGKSMILLWWSKHSWNRLLNVWHAMISKGVKLEKMLVYKVCAFFSSLKRVTWEEMSRIYLALFLKSIKESLNP